MELSEFMWAIFAAAISFFVFYLVIKVAVRNAIVEAHRIMNTKSENGDNTTAGEDDSDS